MNESDCQVLELDRSTWGVGVGLAIMGSITIALGVIAQEVGAKRATDIVVTQVWYVTGIILYSVAGGLEFAALAFAPQSIVVPSSCATIVFNLLFAWRMMNLRIALSAGLILTGCVMISAATNHDNVVCTDAALTKMLGTQTFGWLVSLGSIAAIGLIYFSRDGRLACSIAVGLLASEAAHMARAVDLLIVRSTRGEPFIRPETYLLITSFAIFATSAGLVLNWTLRVFHSVHVVPVAFGVFVVYTVIGGAVVFHELVDLAVVPMFIIFMGLCGVVVGAGLLAADTSAYASVAQRHIERDESVEEESFAA